MLTYFQGTGQLRTASLGLGIGYSGNGDGKNNHASQTIKNVGPCPVGFYFIQPPRDTETHGPFVLPLVPDPDNEMFGRSGFLIHGDSVSHPGRASDGCLIFSRVLRELIWNKMYRILEVKA